VDHRSAAGLKSAPTSPPPTCVAREVSSTVTAGAVSGSLAVELRPWAVEAELFQVALEEAPARELVRRLNRKFVFQFKTGEAISIDPRRMEEVQRIIAMRWEDPGLFEGLE